LTNTDIAYNDGVVRGIMTENVPVLG